MTSNSPQRKGRSGLRLWPVRTVLILAFAGAISIAGAVFASLWTLLDVHGLKAQHQLDSGTLFDLVKLSFGVVAGAGALVALVVTYRRQRIDEDAATRDVTRLHTERFTAAVAQLGADAPAVRLGGVHSLAGLADDAPTLELRQTCIDVLCAYLRMPYSIEDYSTASGSVAHHDYLSGREVRWTVIRVIRDHLKIPVDHSNSWQGCDFDFTGVAFDGGDFGGAVFSSGVVEFTHSKFSGPVSFKGCTFSGANVTFAAARFSRGAVSFVDAKFSGGAVDFVGATFERGSARFTCAEFSGATVDFDSANVVTGTLDFIEASFLSGNIVFDSVECAGSGRLEFRKAQFSGATVSMKGMFIGGRLGFSRAVVSGGAVRFDGSELNQATGVFTRMAFLGGVIRFESVSFIACRVYFDDSIFTQGVVGFGNSTITSDSSVVFNRVTGVAPDDLVPPNAEQPPPGLSLPPDWLRTS